MKLSEGEQSWKNPGLWCSFIRLFFYPCFEDVFYHPPGRGRPFPFRQLSEHAIAYRGVRFVVRPTTGALRHGYLCAIQPCSVNNTMLCPWELIALPGSSEQVNRSCIFPDNLHGWTLCHRQVRQTFHKNLVWRWSSCVPNVLVKSRNGIHFAFLTA